MKTKKKLLPIAVIAICMALCFAMVACGNNETAGGGDNTALDANYAALTVGTQTNVADLADGAYKGYKVTVAEAGNYKFAAADGQTFKVGAGLGGTAESVTLTGEVPANEGVYTLAAATYYVHAYGNGAFTLNKCAPPHVHSYGDYAVTTVPTMTTTGEATAVCGGNCTEGHTTAKPLPEVDINDLAEDTMTTKNGYKLTVIASEDEMGGGDGGFGAYITAYAVEDDNTVSFNTYIVANGSKIKNLPAGESLLIYVGDGDEAVLEAKQGNNVAAGVIVNGGEPIVHLRDGLFSCIITARQATENVTIVEKSLDADYTTLTVGMQTTVSGLESGDYKGYKVTIAEAGYYEFAAAAGQAFEVGSELSGTTANVTLKNKVKAEQEMYELSVAIYYIHVVGNGEFTLKKSKYIPQNFNSSITSENAVNFYKFTVETAGLYRFIAGNNDEPLTVDDIKLGTAFAGETLAVNSPVNADACVYYLNEGACYAEVSKATTFRLAAYDLSKNALAKGSAVTVNGASVDSPSIYTFTVGESETGEYQFVSKKEVAGKQDQFVQLNAGAAKIGTEYDASTGALVALTAVQDKPDTYALNAETTYYVQFTENAKYVLSAFSYGAYWEVIEAGEKPKTAEATGSSNFQFEISKIATSTIYQIVITENTAGAVFTLGESFNADGNLVSKTPVQNNLGIFYDLEKGKTYYLQVSDDAIFKVVQYKYTDKYTFATVNEEYTVAEAAIKEGIAYYFFNSVSDEGNYKLTVKNTTIDKITLGYEFTGDNELAKILTPVEYTENTETTAVYALTEVGLFKKYYIEIQDATATVTFKLEYVKEEVPVVATPLKEGWNTVETMMWEGGESEEYTLTVAGNEVAKLTVEVPYYGNVTITIEKDSFETIILKEGNTTCTLTELGTYKVTVACTESTLYSDTNIRVEKSEPEPEPETTVKMGENSVPGDESGKTFTLVVKEGESYNIVIADSCLYSGMEITITSVGNSPIYMDSYSDTDKTINKPGVYTIIVTGAIDELVFTVTKLS